ncbi:hypothetical protein BGX26_007554 [Mortierella sp. AD094]|nr:hypothetical protein BGX26_007554 [Mortierella sp. AD094]
MLTNDSNGTWVAAKACKTIALPTTQNEFRYFTRDQANLLANLLRQEYASRANDLYEIHCYESQGLDEYEAVSIKPEHFSAIMEWERVVLHTPTKPRPASRSLPKLPFNKSFWDKFAHCVEDNADQEGDEDGD